MDDPELSRLMDLSQDLEYPPLVEQIQHNFSPNQPEALQTLAHQVEDLQGDPRRGAYFVVPSQCLQKPWLRGLYRLKKAAGMNYNLAATLS